MFHEGFMAFLLIFLKAFMHFKLMKRCMTCLLMNQATHSSSSFQVKDHQLKPDKYYISVSWPEVAHEHQGVSSAEGI